LDDQISHDRSVYQRMHAGDTDALRVLVNRYHRPLFDFLFRLTDDRPLADDLAQQTFIRLLNYQGEVPAHLRGWLYTIARNLAYDHFRSARVQHEQTLDFDEIADELFAEVVVSPEQIAILGDQRQLVAAILQQLPSEQREVVLLRFYHDLSLQEIADIVNKPIGTVKSRLFHALKKLKYHLIQIGQTDG
jgi:RNA polymerase sigma-70 factor (ECF subfamily)